MEQVYLGYAVHLPAGRPATDQYTEIEMGAVEREKGGEVRREMKRERAGGKADEETGSSVIEVDERCLLPLPVSPQFSQKTNAEQSNALFLFILRCLYESVGSSETRANGHSLRCFVACRYAF